MVATQVQEEIHHQVGETVPLAVQEEVVLLTQILVFHLLVLELLGRVMLGVELETAVMILEIQVVVEVLVGLVEEVQTLLLAQMVVSV